MKVVNNYGKWISLENSVCGKTQKLLDMDYARP